MKRDPLKHLLAILLALSLILNVTQYIRWYGAFENWSYRYRDALNNPRIACLDWTTMAETDPAKLSLAMGRIYYAPTRELGPVGEYLTTISGSKVYIRVAQDLAIATEVIFHQQFQNLPTPASTTNPTLSLAERRRLQKIYLIYATHLNDQVLFGGKKRELQDALNKARQEFANSSDLKDLYERVAKFWGPSEG